MQCRGCDHAQQKLIVGNIRLCCLTLALLEGKIMTCNALFNVEDYLAVSKLPVTSSHRPGPLQQWVDVTVRTLKEFASYIEFAIATGCHSLRCC